MVPQISFCYLQTNGGCRHKGHSATGWRLRTQGLGNSAVTIAEGGAIHNGNMTSLEIEAHAMLEALRFIESQMQQARLTQPPQREPHHHNNTTKTTKRPYEPKPSTQHAKHHKTNTIDTNNQHDMSPNTPNVPEGTVADIILYMATHKHTHTHNTHTHEHI